MYGCCVAEGEVAVAAHGGDVGSPKLSGGEGVLSPRSGRPQSPKPKKSFFFFGKKKSTPPSPQLPLFFLQSSFFVLSTAEMKD